MEIAKQQIHPVGYFLLIEPLHKPLEAGGGLIVPENMHQSMPMVGTIIEQGDKVDCDTYPVGAVIMFRRYSVDELEIENSETIKEKVYFVSTKPEDDIVIAKIDK